MLHVLKKTAQRFLIVCMSAAAETCVAPDGGEEASENTDDGRCSAQGVQTVREQPERTIRPLVFDRWFKTGDEAAHDSEWGGVFRHIQTARAYNHLPHQEIWLMVRAVHAKFPPPSPPALEQAKASDVRDWCLGLSRPRARTCSGRTTDSQEHCSPARALHIDCADAVSAGLLPRERTRIVLFSPSVGRAAAFLRQAPSRTQFADVDEFTTCRATWLHTLTAALEVLAQPVILYDKCRAYLLHGMSATALHIIDPYKPGRRGCFVTAPLSTLFSKPWMACFLTETTAAAAGRRGQRDRPT